jgi:hypothetical protein
MLQANHSCLRGLLATCPGETLLLAIEQDGDPFGVLVPTAEIVRFYYAPSTRLAQALFWGEYGETFNAERSGVLEEGVVRVHLIISVCK